MSISYNPYNRRTDDNLSRRAVYPELGELPGWANPEVVYNYQDWLAIRDVVAGERAVKAQREVYLPKMAAMDKDEYNSYLSRSSFYNFTARTISAVTGRLLKRAPVMEGFPAKFEDDLAHISYSAESFETFYTKAATEIITMGRYGVLVDMPAESRSTPKPYLTGYTAENIVDWEYDELPLTSAANSPTRMVLSRVVLREFRAKDRRATASSTADAKFVTTSRLPTNTAQYEAFYARYRVLSLNEVGNYTVEVFESDDESNADLTDAYSQGVITPLVRGRPIQYIPFYVFGASDGAAGVSQSPMLSIAQTNLSHYRSYAHLEHGRFYTGFPIYFAEVAAGSDGGAYEIGPSRVWEIDKGARAGIIEFNGNGLKFLENALTQKEAQAAALGGRMIGVTGQSVSESGDQVKVKEMNEKATLMWVATALDQGFGFLLDTWLEWQGSRARDFNIQFDKDFLMQDAGAREYRAVHSMYLDGVLPIEVVFDYFKRFDIVPDYMSMAEFTRLLENAGSFPAQPDAQARIDGFPDKKTQIEEENAEEEVIDTEQQIVDPTVPVAPPVEAK